MLHLYTIPDDQPRPNKANTLPFAGELDETTFENLQEKGIISDRFDVYSTFRWGTALINQMRVTIQKKNMTNDADVQKRSHDNLLIPSKARPAARADRGDLEPARSIVSPPRRGQLIPVHGKHVLQSPCRTPPWGRGRSNIPPPLQPGKGRCFVGAPERRNRPNGHGSARRNAATVRQR